MHSWKEIESYFLRDRFMNAIEAKELGLIDHVLGDVSTIVLIDHQHSRVNFQGQLKPSLQNPA